MKKILSLLMLLVAIVTGVWAADSTPTYTQPSSTLDLADANLATTLSGITWSSKGTINNAYQLTDDYFISSVQILGQTIKDKSAPTWLSQDNSAGNTNDASWDASGIFPASSYFFTGTSKVAKLTTTRMVAIKVTNCTEAYAYAATGSNHTILNVYTVGAGQESVAYNTLTKTGTANTNSNSIASVKSLDPAKTYIIQVVGATTSNANAYAVALKRGSTKTIESQVYAGVKKGSTTLTENTDFTKDGNTITLTNAYKATSAPTDVKLINHITYSDESTKDEDVDVTLKKNGDYFEGSATIGLTSYTVKVPVDVTPTLVADKSSLTVTSARTATGSTTFTLTGANLTGESVSLAFASAVEGLIVSPTSVNITEGAVNQTVTVSYNSDKDVAENSVNLTVSTTGVDAIVIPVTYSSTAPVTELTPVSAATTWNFGNLVANTSHAYYSSNGIKLTDNTTPTKSADAWYIYDNYLDNFFTVKSGETFSTGSIAFYKSEYPIRDNKYAMATGLKFKTTVPGTVVVSFSNTGSDRPYRYLLVNGVPTEFKTNTADAVTTTAIYVPAGEVTLSGAILDAADPKTKSGQDAGEQMVRFNSVAFTPLAEPVPATVGATITECGYTTFSSIYPLDLSTLTEGMKAYVASSANTAKVQLAEVSGKVPARTGLLIKGTANAEFTIAPTTEETTTPASNLFVAVLSSTEIKAADNEKYSNYIFGYKDVADPGFFRVNATLPTLAAGKAYLHTPISANNNSLALDFGDETAVEAIAEGNEAKAATPVKIIKNGKLYIGNYNVAGQQVK